MGGRNSGNTKEGVAKVYAKHGQDFYVKIGSKGGKMSGHINGRRGGFYDSPELARQASKKRWAKQK